MRIITFPVSATRLALGAAVLLIWVGFLSPSASADSCVASGASFSCDATVSNLQVTLTCPGSSETRTGKVGSVTATVIASTVAQGQANALSAAQAEANRVAGERARAACSTPAVASGIVSNIGSLTNGPCRAELGLIACDATASNTTVTARCNEKGKKRATGKLGSATATNYAGSIAQAQSDARNRASVEAIRIATERALTKSCGRPITLPASGLTAGSGAVGAVVSSPPTTTTLPSVARTG